MMVFLSSTLSRSALASAVLALSALAAAAQSSTNLRLMPMGDSITAGFRSSTGNGYRGPLYSALTGQVATLDFVGTQFGGNMLDPDNEGHSGYEISGVAALANASLKMYKPNIVLLDLGINDLRNNDDISAAPNRLASLIDQVLSAEPDATVLVAQLIVNSTPSVESEVVTFNNALPALVNSRASAGKHVYLVDMSALTTADLSDGLHPNDTGYQLMANAWDAAIKQVIAKGWIAYPVSGSATRPVGSIYSGLAGICLDDYNGSGTAGVKADIAACSGSARQQFDFNQNRVSVNGLCLDIVGGGTANGTLVDLWNCSGAANQVWNYTNGTLVNPASGRCLDDPNSNTTPGTQLEIYDCNGGANQQWQLPAEGSVASGISGKCLDDLGGSNANNTESVISTCNNSKEQQWKVVNNSVQFDGGCLDVAGGSTANGALVHLWACSGAPNQIWKFQNGAFVNPASGRCLDDPQSSKTDGTQLDLYDCNGGANQKWTLPPM